MALKLGIMQPYFFPYIGYFSLINYTDEFVFFDTPQYIYHGWVNRNRVLKQGGEPTYIIVPITKGPQKTPINDITINYGQPWIEKIFGQLSIYKRKAPYYQQVISFLHEVLDKEERYLSKLNILSIKKVCEYLGIKRRFSIFSEMNMNLREVNEADEWALYITKAMGFETYVNPPGGQTFFHRDKYQQNGINLEFLEAELVPYVQRIGKFVPGLSIIDVMMFCNEQEIREILNHYKIV